MKFAQVVGVFRFHRKCGRQSEVSACMRFVYSYTTPFHDSLCSPSVSQGWHHTCANSEFRSGSNHSLRDQLHRTNPFSTHALEQNWRYTQGYRVQHCVYWEKMGENLAPSRENWLNKLYALLATFLPCNHGKEWKTLMHWNEIEMKSQKLIGFQGILWRKRYAI